MLYKLSADRPTLEQKKLGPFTFNIEIKKSQPHQAEGLAQARGSSEDYGHLPGYIGPDGDSLDFFVGDRHDGQIYSYKKQQKLNERGERDPKVPWKTTDVKFVVGHGPDEAAKFHAGMTGWTTPTLRYVKDKSFRDWAALERHMNRHYKAASAYTGHLVQPGFLRGFSDSVFRPGDVPKVLRAFADAEVWGPKGPVWRPRVRYHVGSLTGTSTLLAGLAMSPFLLYRGGKALYEKYKAPPEGEEIKMKTADEKGFFPGLVEGLGLGVPAPVRSVRELWSSPKTRHAIGGLTGAHLPAAALAALSAYGLYRGGEHLYDKYTTPSPVTEEPKLAASISARQRFGLLKTAKAAWQKRLESGAIGVKELGRLAQGASIPASGRGWVKNIRNQLSSFTTDLTPEQLVRYQKRVALTNPAYMKAHSVLPHNAPGYGPATVMTFMGPQVYTSPNAGTQIRGTVHSNPAVQRTAATVLASGKELPPWVQKRIARASDPVVTKGIVDHELAERRMLVGGALNKYPTTGFASHAGPDALIAERLGIRDPEAQQLFDKLRQLSPDDAAATALLKQHGMTPNSAIPLGGRAHRSLLGAVEHMPTGAGALRLRAATSTPVYGEAREKLEKYRRYAQTAERLLPQASPAVRPVQALRDNIEGILAAPDRAQQLSPDQIKYMLSRMSST